MCGFQGLLLCLTVEDPLHVLPNPTNRQAHVTSYGLTNPFQSYTTSLGLAHKTAQCQAQNFVL